MGSGTRANGIGDVGAGNAASVAGCVSDVIPLLQSYATVAKADKM